MKKAPILCKDLDFFGGGIVWRFGGDGFGGDGVIEGGDLVVMGGDLVVVLVVVVVVGLKKMG